MRLYSWVNHLYLNKLQCGLQTAHCVSEMSQKYSPSIFTGHGPKSIIAGQWRHFEKWARDFKTIIILEGGNSKNIQSIYDNYINLDVISNQFPHVSFYEDDDSLNNALTAISIIVPSYIYDPTVDPLFDYDIFLGYDMSRLRKFIMSSKLVNT